MGLHFKGRHFERLCTQNDVHKVTNVHTKFSSAEGPSALENGEGMRTVK